MSDTNQYLVEIKEIQPTIWVYRDSDGSVKERTQTKEEREEQIVPPRGEYTFRVKAFAKKFEMDNYDKTGKEWMTRLLLEIVAGPNAKAKGHMTTVLCSMKMSKSSNLGKVYMATTGRGLEREMGSADPTLMLEQEFSVYAKQDKTDENGNRTKTVLAWETVGKPGEAGAASEDDDFRS